MCEQREEGQQDTTDTPTLDLEQRSRLISCTEVVKSAKQSEPIWDDYEASAVEE